MKIFNILSILLVLLFISCFVSGQDGRASRADIREHREYEKQMRKEQRERELEQKSGITKKMVEIQRFVLEADNLSDKYGNRIMVSPNINFIMIDSLDGVLQFGSAFTVGYNGVGGQTLDGRITKYEYSMMGRNKDSYNIRMIFMSPIGTYDITMTVNPEGYADATIRGNWSGQLNYHGKLVPLGLSKVYKGHSLF
ncbi:MAG: hypothetical protein AMS27_01830 [Bacteroides sp. SM23_62_1]|nr:MAG: hypothetical protein AMS27_01830 [Bacteroides sp. SM23_62_1]